MNWIRALAVRFRTGIGIDPSAWLTTGHDAKKRHCAGNCKSWRHRLLKGARFGLCCMVIPVGSGLPTAHAGFFVDGHYTDDTEMLGRLLKNGSQLVIEPGVYAEGIVIDRDNVLVSGTKGVLFKEALLKNSNTSLLVKGDNVTIIGVECSDVRALNKRGSCVLQQGKNLSLQDIYFHDSDQGVLSRAGTGGLEILNSRFERLGYLGNAFGINAANDRVVIDNSQILSAANNSHAIRSTALVTLIHNSVIASINSEDSRLLEFPHGGTVRITDSVLQKGPNSAQRQLIGYGLSGLYTPGTTVHRLVVRSNKIYMERERGNRLVAVIDQPDRALFVDVSGNALIGTADDLGEFAADNFIFADRKAAGVSPFPALR